MTKLQSECRHYNNNLIPFYQAVAHVMQPCLVAVTFQQFVVKFVKAQKFFPHNGYDAGVLKMAGNPTYSPHPGNVPQTKY